MNGAGIAPGSLVDGFRVGERLHAGAMGEIFAVTREGESLPMVLKVPLRGKSAPADVLLAFETEAMILPRLAGPHVPRFFAAGDITTLPYIVMEHVPGTCLANRAPGAMPAEEVARVGAAIADALHDVHAQDVIHHDLKPDNVILRPDGTAVVLDFALAHHTDLPDLLAEEQRFASGSAPYLSPEQLRDSRHDPRSDLFALGVMLYELATDRLPFGIPVSFAGMADRLWREPVPPRALAAATPPWLQEVILRCLEPDPAERYQSAALLAFDLRNPGHVPLTGRASREAPRLAHQALRWWRQRAAVLPALERPPAPATVVMVAVDTSHPDDARHPELQRTVRRILSLSGEFRIVCVSVIGGGPDADRDAPDRHVDHRIRLRHWIGPLGVPPERVSLHVLEGADAAGALVDFARANNVELIVLGAPAPGERAFAWWRSVASSVTAQAPCSVHVVRRAAGRGGPQAS